MKGLCLDTLNWLTTVPAGDINFRSALNRANAATLRAALESVPETRKTKTRLLQSRLERLEQENIMAREKKEPRAHDAEAETATQIYQVAKAEAETQLAAMREEVGAIREESQAMGALTAIGANIAYNELLRAITLQRVKQAKEYKKGGMTWDAFCDALDMPRRTVDLMLEDLRPVIDSFSACFAGFCGMPFSKIRLLGKQVSANLAEIENGCLIYGDESIPLTPEHRDDIQALIDRINEEAREKIDDAQAQLSAKDKVLKSKQELLNKQERILQKFENQAREAGLTPDENAFIQLMKNKHTSFEGYMLSVEPDFVMGNAGEITPRMRACLISTLHYMKMLVSAAYDTAVMNYGSPGLNPELMEEFEAWEKAQGLDQ